MTATGNEPVKLSQLKTTVKDITPKLLSVEVSTQATPLEIARHFSFKSNIPVTVYLADYGTFFQIKSVYNSSGYVTLTLSSDYSRDVLMQKLSTPFNNGANINMIDIYGGYAGVFKWLPLNVKSDKPEVGILANTGISNNYQFIFFNFFVEK